MKPTIDQQIKDETSGEINKWLIQLEDWVGYDENNKEHLQAHKDTKIRMFDIVQKVLERQRELILELILEEPSENTGTDEKIRILGKIREL